MASNTNIVPGYRQAIDDDRVICLSNIEKLEPKADVEFQVRAQLRMPPCEFIWPEDREPMAQNMGWCHIVFDNFLLAETALAMLPGLRCWARMVKPEKVSGAMLSTFSSPMTEVIKMPEIAQTPEAIPTPKVLDTPKVTNTQNALRLTPLVANDCIPLSSTEVEKAHPTPQSTTDDYGSRVRALDKEILAERKIVLADQERQGKEEEPRIDITDTFIKTDASGKPVAKEVSKVTTGTIASPSRTVVETVKPGELSLKPEESGKLPDLAEAEEVDTTETVAKYTLQRWPRAMIYDHRNPLQLEQAVFNYWQGLAKAYNLLPPTHPEQARVLSPCI